MDLENDKIFSRSELYDLAFSWDLSNEIHFFESLIQESPGRHILVSACGTGRYALPLAKLGYWVTAFDLHSKMLEFALRIRSHPNIQYLFDDLGVLSSIKTNSQDFGTLLNNSFRYILDKRKAIEHLNQISRILKPGGFYLMELGLNDDPRMIGKSVEWTVCKGGETLKARWTLKDLQIPYAVDIVNISFGNEHVEEEQFQRVWTFGEIQKALKDTALEIIQCYNYLNQEEVTMTEAATHSGKYYLLLKKWVMV